MNDELIANVAVSTIETFMLSNGIAPSVDWDINCSDCFRQYYGHLVITVCGRALVNADRDIDVLWEKFVNFILKNNSHFSAVKFSPYNLERYEHSEATYIYLSVSH